MTPSAALSFSAHAIGRDIGAGLSDLGVRYVLILVSDPADGSGGIDMGCSSNINPEAVAQVMRAAADSADANIERLRPGVNLGDVSQKGPAS